MSEFTPTWKQPSHPAHIEIVKGTIPYTSSARSLVALPVRALFSKIDSAIAAAQKTYTSVQTGRSANIELCSNLVYCDHSCSPYLEFDMSTFEVRVARDWPLSAGDELTFFNPSTEWDMVQSFKCTCGSQNCLGLISGSKELDSTVLSQYSMNPHVEELLVEGAKSTMRTSVVEI